MPDSADIADINPALSGLAARLEETLPDDAHGVGIDHIPIDRIGEHVAVDGLLTRIATPIEHRTWFDDCEPAHRQLRAAALFCLKEACAKAMGVGFGAKLKWSDLEIQSLKADAIFPVRCDADGARTLVAGHVVVEDVVIAVAGAGG